MRTTLTIDDDALTAAKAIARPKIQPRERNGIPLLPVQNPDAIVTPEIINALRDELP